jgi:hypothetical protein
MKIITNNELHEKYTGAVGYEHYNDILYNKDLILDKYGYTKSINVDIPTYQGKSSLDFIVALNPFSTESNFDFFNNIKLVIDTPFTPFTPLDVDSLTIELKIGGQLINKIENIEFQINNLKTLGLVDSSVIFEKTKTIIPLPFFNKNFIMWGRFNLSKFEIIIKNNNNKNYSYLYTSLIGDTFKLNTNEKDYLYYKLNTNEKDYLYYNQVGKHDTKKYIQSSMESMCIPYTLKDLEKICFIIYQNNLITSRIDTTKKRKREEPFVLEKKIEIRQSNPVTDLFLNIPNMDIVENVKLEFNDDVYYNGPPVTSTGSNDTIHFQFSKDFKTVNFSRVKNCLLTIKYKNNDYKDYKDHYLNIHCINLNSIGTQAGCYGVYCTNY